MNQALQTTSPDTNANAFADADIQNIQLQKQQWDIQTGLSGGPPKERSRSVNDLNNRIQPSRAPAFERYSRRVSDFLNQFTDIDRDAFVADVIDAMVKRNGSARVADVMGGLSIWMRELIRDPHFDCSHVQMTTVDLFDWSKGGAEGGIARALAVVGEDILDEQYRPHAFITDGTQPIFSAAEAPDLTVVLEGIQYVDDKLAAVVNWYNQAADNGIILIQSSKWGEQVKFEDAPEPPLRVMAKNLSNAGITTLSQGECCDFDSLLGVVVEDVFNDLDLLLLQKKPGTQLKMNTRFVRAEPIYRGHVSSHYEQPTAGQAIVTVHEREMLDE